MAERLEPAVPSGKKRLKVLVNLATLKQGGGQNVAMNFLYAINRDRGLCDGMALSYVVARDSAPHAYLKNAGTDRFYVFSRNPAVRILQEIFLGSYIVAREGFDAIYSYFGFGAFVGRTPQISGAADSNLFFPEIDFWHHYRGLPRLKRRLVDWYRLRNLKRASAVIFENRIMEERARELYQLRETAVILPSIDFSSKQEEILLPELQAAMPKGLFLCGWQLNKNVMLIPEIAAILKQRGKPFLFVLTAPKDGSALHLEFEDLARRRGVEDMVKVVGQVRKEQLPDLFRQIEFVFLLSKLESFSNNIIEAWHYRRPFVVSDEPWSRSICGNAAIYVQRDSAEDIADKICRLLDDEAFGRDTVENGRLALNGYPSIETRILQEFEYIRHVSKAH